MEAGSLFSICGCECHSVKIVVKPFTHGSVIRAFLHAVGVKPLRLAWSDTRGCVDPICACRSSAS